MKKLLLLLLLFPSVALAQNNLPPSTYSYSSCDQEMPGLGGYFCLSNGSATMWKPFSGDISQYTGPACSPTNSSQCGQIYVNGMTWGGPGGTHIPMATTAPGVGACLGNTGSGIGGIPCGGGSSAPGGAANSVQYNNGGMFGGVSLTTNTLLQGGAAAPQAVSVPNCAYALSYNTTTNAFGCNTLGTLASLNVGTGLAVVLDALDVSLPGGTLPAHNFATALSVNGVLTGSQPSCSDLSNAETGCSTAVGALATLGAGTGLSSSGGNLNITNTAVTPGSCTNCNLTYNQQGQLTAAANGSGGSGVPNGGPPQLVGYSATNTGEAETVSGDCTFARTGTNAYGITCTKTNGNLFTSATFGASLNLSTLISGDATISSGGALTVTKTNGTAFGALATLGVGTGLVASGGNLGLIGCGSVAPTVASCGTSPVQPSSANNCQGSFTTGTGSPTACTMTFATAAIGSLTGLPTCMFRDNTTPSSTVLITDAPTVAPSATDVLSFSGAATSHQIKYLCSWIN
jgi:hypothetical protein